MSATVEVVALAVGDRVKFAEEKQRYTVRGVTRGGRFAICTKPFNPLRTVLYSVVDFQRGVRGKDNYYGLGYESDADVAAALHQFQHTENDDPPDLTNACESADGFWCHGGADVSFRTANHITLRIDSVTKAAK